MWRKRFWKATHNYHVDVAGTILLGVLIIEGNLANMMLYLQSLIQWNTSHLQSSILQKAVDRHRTKIGWRDNNTPMSMNMLKFSTTNPAFGKSNLIQPMNCTKTNHTTRQQWFAWKQLSHFQKADDLLANSLPRPPQNIWDYDGPLPPYIAISSMALKLPASPYPFVMLGLQIMAQKTSKTTYTTSC